MNDVQDIVERHGPFSTVMVVGNREDIDQSRLTILSDAGVNVLGPIASVDGALLIAGRIGPDVALISEGVAREYAGAELIRRLEETWGVPSVTLRNG